MTTLDARIATAVPADMHERVRELHRVHDEARRGPTWPSPPAHP